MPCPKAFLCGHCKPQKNAKKNPKPQAKPKPLSLSVAPMPICDSCPAGVTVTWLRVLQRLKVCFVLPWMWWPRVRLTWPPDPQCEESRNTSFHSPHSSCPHCSSSHCCLSWPKTAAGAVGCMPSSSEHSSCVSQVFAALSKYIWRSRKGEGERWGFSKTLAVGGTVAYFNLCQHCALEELPLKCSSSSLVDIS